MADEFSDINLKPEACNLELLILRVIRELRPTLRARRIGTETRFDSQVEFIYADKNHLTDILRTLIANVVESVQPGDTIRLTVSGEKARNAIRLLIEASRPDDSVGGFASIEPLDLNTLAVISLPVAYQLIELHGGSVQVGREPADVLRFAVDLPWEAVELKGRKATPEAKPTTNAFSKALVIEDSLVDAALIEDYLHTINIHTYRLSTAENLVDEVLHHRPDVIVLDILLPRRSGWDALTELKANPNTSSIPVLVVSVLDQQQKGETLGADAYLVKPFKLDALRDSLQNLSEKSLEASQSLLVSLGVPKILFADDNELTAQAYMDFLLSRHYQVLMARDGQEAIDLANEMDPDLIIMDIQMPRVDGLEAIRQIRANPAHANTPIFALTALTMPGDRERCLAAGADEYYSKPLSLLELQRVITKSLVGSMKS